MNESSYQTELSKAIRPFWHRLAMAAGAGGTAGALAKLADESALANRVGLNDLGTYLGTWVVALAVLALMSDSRRAAVVAALGFFVVMVVAYYGVTRLLYGFLPLWPFLLWLGLAMTAVPVLAALMFDAKGAGWRGAFGAALPVGLLLWEAYSLRLTLPLHATQFAFDLMAGAVLFSMIGRRWGMWWETAVMILAVVAVASVASRMLPYALGLIL